MSSNSSRHVRKINRRTLIGGAGGLVLAHATASKFGMPYIGNAAASDPIKIGMIYAKTGAVADQAEYMAQGSLLALELRNKTLLGRQAEVVWLDEPTPQNAQQNAERLIGEHRVVGIVGGSLSSSALAISAAMKKAKLPYVAPNAGAIDLTGRLCNKYTFRLQPPADVHTRVLAPYCAGLGKKWYLITAAYAVGQDIKRSFTEFSAANGGTIIGADEVPLNTADYSSFILKIRAAKPDVVVGGVPGSDISTFLKQWNELGMKGKIPFAEIAVGATDLWGVGPEAAEGLFTLNWYHKSPNNPPEEQAMAASYSRNTNARQPTRLGWAGWR